MVEIKNLTKRYGNHHALNDVSFTVSRGEIVGFLGPNGAGKSTTMNIITGYIASNGGSVTIGGHDIVAEPKLAKKSIGYLPENPPLYMDMKVLEYLKFVYELKGAEENDMDEHIQSIMQLVDIVDVKSRLIKNLSKGYKQRVGLAQALIGSPEVLILDEPTVGLDPNQIIEVRNVIRNLGKEHTIILSTHILSEVSEVCDRIIIINNGKIVAEDTPQNLASSMAGAVSILARVEGEENKILSVISSIDGVISAQSEGTVEEGSYDIMIEVQSGIDIRKSLSRTLLANDMTVLMLKDAAVSLENIFAQLTADDSSITAYEAGKQDAKQPEQDKQEDMEYREITGEDGDADAIDFEKEGADDESDI